MFVNKLKMDSIASAVEKIMSEEEKNKKMSASYGADEQEETPARKSIKAHGGPVEQPKMGLAKEEIEQIDELNKNTLKSYVSKATDSARTMPGYGTKAEKSKKTIRHTGISKAIEKLAKEEVELDERKMSEPEMKKREEIVKSMKKGFSGFRERYGKRAKDVMYATATKRAMGEEAEEVDEALIGNQKKIDKNHNNKIDAQDFKILRSKKNTKETYGEALNPKKKTMDTLAGRVEVPADTHNQHTSTKVELKAEGWEDMMKAVKDRAGPQPSGGSGVKAGSRYGGSKQKDKPEQDVDKKKVNESKRPDQDNVPFVTDEAKPLTVAKHLAKKTMSRIKNEMLGKTGTSE